MLKLPTAVLSAILAVSFSQLAAAQSANTTSPNNPAATPGIEKDQSRDSDRAVYRGRRSTKESTTGSTAGATAPNRGSPNNPAATPNLRKDDSQHGYSNDTSGAGSTSSPNNPAATPDQKRRQEQR